MKHPDPKRHLQVSLAKSAGRIIAGIVLMFGSFWLAGLFFVLAEALGIVEELV